MWLFAAMIICIYSPLAWVRKIQYFKVGYKIGNVMIIAVTLLIMIMSLRGLLNHNYPIHTGFKPIASKYWDTIGFSFYAFEGIGTVLPIMKESQNTQTFPFVLKCALVSLSVYFTIFGMICYKYFGDEQSESIIINNFSDKNVIIRIFKLLFCVNLVFSYPLTIYPAN